MAYEFASRLETFPNYRKFETTFAGRPFVVETGKMCGLSNGSAMIRYGETCVLCNVTMSDKPRDGVDFFPLSVEFEEKLYAAGRIPGSFMRREGRPGEHAILSSRVVDRPIRPLFPKDMRNDVCVTMTVMSQDPDCSAEISGMNGASLAIAMSDIPWNGPIAGVFVGLVDGEIVLNPTKEQREHSDLSLTLAASEEKIVMIEAGANEVDEETMMKAIRAGHEEIRKMLAFINSIVAEIGKPKKSFTPVELDHALLADVYANHLEDVKAAMNTDDKNVRDAAMLPIMDAIAAEHPELTAADLDLISYKLQKKVVRTWLLEDGKRVDGRGINEIRPLAAEVGLLPRVHGSGMFTRGQTQVLTICTLGSTKDAQLMDDLSDTPYKRYIHHYNFPPYSVGEARAPRSPGRREIGHRAGDFRAPTLAARELDAQALAYFLQAELLDQRFAALRLIGLAEVGHLEHGPDVVLHAQATEYRRLLGQVAHAHLRTAVNGFIRKFRDAALIVLEENLPLVGLDEPDDHVERGRFPRSVGPEQADDFSLIHIDRDVVHHRSGLVFLDQFACVEAHFFRGILYKVS